LFPLAYPARRAIGLPSGTDTVAGGDRKRSPTPTGRPFGLR